MKSLYLFVFLSVMGGLQAANKSLVQKIINTKHGQSMEELTEIYGKGSSTSKQMVWKNESYTFVSKKDKELFYLEPESLNVKDLPFEKYEFKRSLSGDQNLGGVLSAPKSGIYLSASPDGNISRIYWKSPWKGKAELSKKEALKLLKDAEVKNAEATK